LSKLRLPARPTIVSNVGNHSGSFRCSSRALRVVALPVSGRGRACARACGTWRIPTARISWSSDNGTAGFDHLPLTSLPCGLACSVRRVEITTAWRAADEAHEPEALLLRLTSGSTRASKVVIASEHNVFCDGATSLKDGYPFR
jgi:hypothetical protein